VVCDLVVEVLPETDGLAVCVFEGGAELLLFGDCELVFEEDAELDGLVDELEERVLIEEIEDVVDVEGEREEVVDRVFRDDVEEERDCVVLVVGLLDDVVVLDTDGLEVVVLEAVVESDCLAVCVVDFEEVELGVDKKEGFAVRVAAQEGIESRVHIADLVAVVVLELVFDADGVNVGRAPSLARFLWFAAYEDTCVAIEDTFSKPTSKRSQRI